MKIKYYLKKNTKFLNDIKINQASLMNFRSRSNNILRNSQVKNNVAFTANVKNKHLRTQINLPFINFFLLPQKTKPFFWNKYKEIKKTILPKKRNQQFYKLTVQLKNIKENIIKNMFCNIKAKLFVEVLKKKRWQWKPSRRKIPYFLTRKNKKKQTKTKTNFPRIRRFPLRWANSHAKIAHIDLTIGNEAVRDIAPLEGLAWAGGSRKSILDEWYNWKFFYFYEEDYVGSYEKWNRGAIKPLYPKPFVPPRYLYFLSYNWTPYYYAMFRLLSIWKKQKTFIRLKTILFTKIKQYQFQTKINNNNNTQEHITSVNNFVKIKKTKIQLLHFFAATTKIKEFQNKLSLFNKSENTQILLNCNRVFKNNKIKTCRKWFLENIPVNRNILKKIFYFLVVIFKIKSKKNILLFWVKNLKTIYNNFFVTLTTRAALLFKLQKIFVLNFYLKKLKKKKNLFFISTKNYIVTKKPLFCKNFNILFQHKSNKKYLNKQNKIYLFFIKNKFHLFKNFQKLKKKKAQKLFLQPQKNIKSTANLYKNIFSAFINKKNFNFKFFLNNNQLKYINFLRLRKSHLLGNFSLQKKTYFVTLSKWYKWVDKTIPVLRKWHNYYIIYKFDHTQKNPRAYYNISRWNAKTNKWLNPVIYGRKLFWHHLPSKITKEVRHQSRYKSLEPYWWYTKYLSDKWNYITRVNKSARFKEILFGRIILPAIDYLKKKQFLFIKKNVSHVKPLGLQHSRPAMFLGKFERRIDILAYKLNFAPTIQWARSFVKSGLIYVSSLSFWKTRDYKNILTKKQKFPLLTTLKLNANLCYVAYFDNLVLNKQFSHYGRQIWKIPFAITLPAYRVRLKSVIHWSSRNIRTIFFKNLCKRYLPRYFIYNKNKTIAYFWRNLTLIDIERQRAATRIRWSTVKWLM